MAQSRAKSSTNLRLVGVNFPGMKIDHRRFSFDMIDMPKPPLRHAIGKYPKVTSAPDAQVVVQLAYRRWRKFKYPVSERSDLPVGETVCTGNTIEVMSDGKHGRIEPVAFLGQNIDSPQRVLNHRETWCSIAPHGFLNLIRQAYRGAAEVQTELLRRHCL